MRRLLPWVTTPVVTRAPPSVSRAVAPTTAVAFSLNLAAVTQLLNQIGVRP